MAWYYKEGDNEAGPVDKVRLQALYKEKKIDADTLVRDENQTQWKPLKEWFGKKPKAATPPEPPSRPAPPAQAHQPNDNPQPGNGPAIAVCSQCGRSFPQDQVVRFEGKSICAACKPLFVQKLKEGVDLPTNLRYAGFWIRAAAKIIDGIILMVAQWALLIPLNMAFFSSMTMDPDNPDMAAFFGMMGLQMAVGILIPASYGTFFIGRFAATPGKMACRLKITAPNGDFISYLRAFGRFWAELVSSMLLGIGYLMVAFDGEKRALHDRICATRVIYKN
ncbi:RDD domain containing protein [Desulfosarcina cetonica]|uniref:RDD family protein n=1 Tax=Desulfosarcina cetonica TaxID=90730 RepID=UPI0006D0A21B|nr:RDD family protein [Desulfosarcina cetonica]VTR67901.1 RDD domain containing protein [Desulfosarcina cetonica]